MRMISSHYRIARGACTYDTKRPFLSANSIKFFFHSIFWINSSCHSFTSNIVVSHFDCNADTYMPCQCRCHVMCVSVCLFLSIFSVHALSSVRVAKGKKTTKLTWCYRLSAHWQLLCVCVHICETYSFSIWLEPTYLPQDSSAAAHAHCNLNEWTSNKENELRNKLTPLKQQQKKEKWERIKERPRQRFSTL